MNLHSVSLPCFLYRVYKNKYRFLADFLSIVNLECCVFDVKIGQRFVNLDITYVMFVIVYCSFISLYCYCFVYYLFISTL